MLRTNRSAIVARLQSTLVIARAKSRYPELRCLSQTSSAQSINAKTVIIGTGKDGLPVILGAPASPAGSTTPDGSENKERTTAAGPALPLDKTPALH
jgi:hypothetical protein